MTWKKKNSERLKKRIINLSLSFGGMTQAEIAKKVHRSPVYVSRVLKKYDEHIRIQMMDLDKAMEILKTLSGWELCLLLRTVERMKNYDAAVCLFNQAHQSSVSDLLPYFRNNKSLQQKVRNTLWPPKK